MFLLSESYILLKVVPPEDPVYLLPPPQGVALLVLPRLEVEAAPTSYSGQLGLLQRLQGLKNARLLVHAVPDGSLLGHDLVLLLVLILVVVVTAADLKSGQRVIGRSFVARLVLRNVNNYYLFRRLINSSYCGCALSASLVASPRGRPPGLRPRPGSRGCC